MSNPRLFADDASLFLVVQDTNLSVNALKNDLLRINNWACKWKMSFNPHPSKQAQEAIFTRRFKNPGNGNPVLIFSNNQVTQTPYQKHIGLILVNFGKHLR